MGYLRLDGSELVPTPDCVRTLEVDGPMVLCALDDVVKPNAGIASGHHINLRLKIREDVRVESQRHKG